MRVLVSAVIGLAVTAWVYVHVPGLSPGLVAIAAPTAGTIVFSAVFRLLLLLFPLEDT
jgi:hypothetical protein